MVHLKSIPWALKNSCDCQIHFPICKMNLYSLNNPVMAFLSGKLLFL